MLLPAALSVGSGQQHQQAAKFHDQHDTNRFDVSSVGPSLGISILGSE